MIVGVGALQMMLDRGKELDWFESMKLLFGNYSNSLLNLFYRMGIGEKHPVIDLSLFKDRILLLEF